MAELIERFQLPESYSESSLNGVRFIKSLQHISRTPILFMNQAFASLPREKRLDILKIRSFSMMKTITWRSQWCRKVPLIQALLWKEPR
jgi:hypothetical protein